MKIEIRLRIDAGESNSCEEEVWVLDKAHDQLEHIGLSLDEAKALLGRLQEGVGCGKGRKTTLSASLRRNFQHG